MYLKEYAITSFSGEGQKPSGQKPKIEILKIWQKAYDFSSSRRIKKLNDGYLIWGEYIYDVMGEKIQVFTKIDNTGNVTWKCSQKMNSLYTKFKHAQSICVLENNDELFIFFDNMRCTKYSISGQLIWDKYYGMDYDVFNYALKNTIGKNTQEK